MTVKDRDLLRHEINNQLEILLASTELLEVGCSDVKRHSRILQMQTAIKRLKILLDKLEHKARD